MTRAGTGCGTGSGGASAPVGAGNGTGSGLPGEVNSEGETVQAPTIAGPPEGAMGVIHGDDFGCDLDAMGADKPPKPSLDPSEMFSPRSMANLDEKMAAIVGHEEDDTITVQASQQPSLAQQRLPRSRPASQFAPCFV